jgi:uncharacterized membrane protein (UPF0127 family)
MKIKLKNSTIEADVADTFYKRLMGLSLSEKKNMFFLMPYEYKWSLWMFLVKYPIKMIFIDKNKTVIDIKEGKPITPNPDTWKTYSPSRPCKYILETPFGLKIKVGDTLEF